MKQKIVFLFVSILFSILSFAQLIISEFRLRGPNGANDEFIEIYNNSNTDHTVAGGGTGYAVAASNGIARFVIPNGTVIPARGHYLGVNSVGYSLASYPAGNGTTATGDATYTTDIPDNAGIALFNTSVAANFTLANRLDAVGSTSEANTLYKEGTGYPALTPFSIDYCFHRRQMAGFPQETNNNAADFKFEDTNGTSAGAGQSLGAPGPENLSSPVNSSGALVVTPLDNAVAGGVAPNVVRDFTSDPPNNSTFGTLDFRLKVTNNTGGNITRLRFRIVDLSTFPSPSGIADLRPRTSTAIVVTTSTGNVTVQGTTLEQPPSQPNGGGINSSMSVGVITLGTPLANGATTNIRLLCGIQQTGTIKLDLLLEALPQGGGGTAGSGTGASTPFIYRGGTDAPITFNPTGATAALGDVIISEFRLRGPNGANDEFIELHNKTNNDILVSTTDGSSGWSVAGSNGVIRFVIPNGTVIPAHGHFLGINSVGYSIGSYPAGNGTTATGDAIYNADIPDNAGIALFNTSNTANFALATRMDAVGSTSEANTLYKEGTGYPALTPFSIDYCWRRKTYAGGPADSDNNAADLEFDDTNGTSAGGGQRLGAPGPENLSSPIKSNPSLLVSLLDPCVDAFSPPNRVRDFTSDPANNSTFGTWDLRYTITNNTGVAITRLRFRIDSISTFPAPAGFADLRPRTSTAVVVTVDRTPCGSGTSNVTVQGTSLEQPPSQPNGGGYNSSMSAGVITLATPLANGASVDIRMLFGVQQDGVFAIKFSPEVLPNAAAAGAIAPPVFVSSIPPCTMPTISCPANITIPASAGQCSRTVTYSPTVGGSPAPALTYSFSGATTGSGNGDGSGSVFNVGTTTVTLTATNTCGSVNCSFNVTVNDIEPPLITCPPNVVASNNPGQCSVMVMFALPTATDNCPGVTVTTVPASGSTFPVGVTTVTATATDAAGNTGTCTFTVTVNDIQPPLITCPPNVVASNNPGQCSAMVMFALPTATDNCPGVTVTTVPASGSTFPVGVTTVTATATDAAGNTGTCTFTVTVNDVEPPLITCPANIVASNAPGQCGASVTTPNPTNTDNCGVTVRTWTLTGATTGASAVSGLNNVGTQTFNVGVTTVTYTSRDAAGNTATCTFTVTVNDVQPPVITCPANITVGNDPGLCSAVVNYGLPSASDNCNKLQVPQTILAHGGGAITFAGNNAPGGYYFNITNNSATPKTISSLSVRFGTTSVGGAVPSPAPVSVYVTTSATTYVGNQTNAGAWTAIGTGIPVTVAGPNSEFSLVPLPNGGFTLSPGQSKGMYVLGTVSSLLYNSAANSNTTPISNGVLTVTPGQASSGLFTAGASPRIPNIIINYITLTQTAGLPSGSVFPVGVTTNTYTATDDAGNTASCSFTVRVNDTQAPTITCPANITVTSPAGSCTAVVSYTATANDNCPGVTVQVVSGPASGSAFPVGTTTVTLRAVDAAGNVSANCSFTVTVLDGQLPVITAQPQNRTVCAGQSATFSVTAITSPNANGPLSYQWQSWNGTAWVDISGATASSYTVSNTTVSQNTNSYRVRVIGLCTTITSAHATLYVNPNPTVTLTTNIPPAILPTQSVTITAVPSIAGGSYQWYKNGVLIAGATNPTLGPLTVADIGSYRVVYTAPTGCVGTSADLAVTGLASPNLYVYPNPNRGQFTVQFYNQSNEEVTLRIFDAKGALVYQRKYTTTLPYTNINVNLADGRILTAGVYVVDVLDSGGRQIGTRRIIVYQ